MPDWAAALDKFLRDTELPVLADAGSVSRDDAQTWASEQYDAFAERRRLTAEAEAEERYVDDLRKSAKILESHRKEPPTKKKKKVSGQKKRKRGSSKKGGG